MEAKLPKSLSESSQALILDMITLSTNQVILPRLSPYIALLLLITHQPPQTHRVRPAAASVSHTESGPSGSRETQPGDDDEDRELMSRDDLKGKR